MSKDDIDDIKDQIEIADELLVDYAEQLAKIHHIICALQVQRKDLLNKLEIIKSDNVLDPDKDL